MYNTRGSLSISTNAIVVLIVAVIMLGLIIGLVNTAFGQVERQFFEHLDQTEPAPAGVSSSTPVTLSRTSIRAGRGELVGVKVNILNTQGNDIETKPEIECVGGVNVVKEDSELVFEQTLVPGESHIFTYIFEINPSADLPVGTHLCRMTGKDIASSGAEFRLTIE
ncbi:MAG: hypothetical protein ACMXYD_00665 [Candidatus Woesearchaeota archaeon]